jgi:hypothetical protein
MYCWGGGGSGSAPLSSSQPAPVSCGLSSGVLTYSGLDVHACLIASGGSVSCWGEIWTTGQGSLNSIASTPTTFTGVSNAVHLASVGENTCALESNGTVYCMGDNQYYLLGNTGGDNLSSFTENNYLTQIIQVCGAGYGSGSRPGTYCALTTGGAVSCWGSNNYGQLGQGSTTLGTQYIPIAVSGLSSGVIGLQGFGYDPTLGWAGGFCAMLQSGSVTCWGGMYSSFNTPTLTSVSIP